jgi:Tfp pilus assembly protein PilF
MPAINEKDLLATLERPGEFRQTFEDSLSAYNAGDFAAAEEKLKPILAAYPSNPSVLFVEAMAEYRKGNLTQAADLMGRSESTQPMSAFRCWANLQMGLITGSRARIDRECRHLAGHPEYKDEVRRISETVAQRGA